MEECERAVRTAIQGAQKMAGLRVDHVIVSFSGGRPRSYGCTGEVEVEHGAVAERDIGHVLAACEIPDYGHDRDALHALPVNFASTSARGLTDPRGQIGRDLAVDMHLVTVGSTPLRNILHCIRRCDLELGGIVVSSYASGLASLVEDEQELGAACVDIGAGRHRHLDLRAAADDLRRLPCGWAACTSPRTSARGCRSRCRTPSG